ncbi:MAG: GNAT family N-acetyltransferase [Candidatus Devosia phytovorans]|uniref:GNAT family N-acetyltransferase n=1 Tax=Candidatus Devosia phytovorans TaxID=3121372 RepID=A0AAJ5VT37_9HYPH|nr:GNAT family N-acetyltransferase [Devosia sp.]WEK04289.1 MAG: GNAT family N-acetyltransferase [Devosia sp.]
MSSLTALPRADEKRRLLVAERALADTQVLRAEVVRTREAFDVMAHQWEGLETQVPGAVLFQSSGWARAIFDFEAARGNVDFAPVIATLTDGQRLVAVLPLEYVQSHSRRILTALGHAFSQYSDAIISPGLNPREAMAKMLHAAIAASPCDMVSLLKVRSDSQMAKGMPANHMVTGAEQGAPYVALDAFDDYAAYFQTIKPKTRKNMRNDRNRLERDGAVTHHVAETSAEAQAVIERTLTGRANRLKDQGLSSRAFRDTSFVDFCTGLPSRSDIAIMAMSLRHKGEEIAEQWGFVHKRRYYAFVASRDFANSDESPGRMHLGEVIHACADRGMLGADLMVPVMPYKLTWSTEVVTVKDYALPVTPRGVLMLNLWDKTLRPMLKNAVLNMPKGLRGVLMKATGRSL